MIVNHVKSYLETNREEDMAEKFFELHFKVDQDLYDEVQNVLATLGITVEKATELFLRPLLVLEKSRLNTRMWIFNLQKNVARSVRKVSLKL